MKKLILLVTTAIVSGCCLKTPSYDEMAITHYDSFYVDRFEFNGHYYLEFNFGKPCIVHDPDCKKCKKELDW